MGNDLPQLRETVFELEAMMTEQHKEYYLLTRDDLEEFYDSLAHVMGKEYADNVWATIEARSHPVSIPPDGAAPE